MVLRDAEHNNRRCELFFLRLQRGEVVDEANLQAHPYTVSESTTSTRSSPHLRVARQIPAHRLPF